MFPAHYCFSDRTSRNHRIRISSPFSRVVFMVSKRDPISSCDFRFGQPESLVD